jgi:uncharacterized membrane protein YdfJ with MMPL/SSD domain
MDYENTTNEAKAWWYKASDWVAAHPKTVMVIVAVVIIAAIAL